MSREHQLIDALRRALWLLETLKDEAYMAEDDDKDAEMYQAAIKHVDCAMQRLGIDVGKAGMSRQCQGRGVGGDER